jgi:hypothetical protein
MDEEKDPGIVPPLETVLEHKATYQSRIVFRGTSGIVAPTLEVLNEAIENVLVDFGGKGAVAVNVTSERLDTD